MNNWLKQTFINVLSRLLSAWRWLIWLIVIGIIFAVCVNWTMARRATPQIQAIIAEVPTSSVALVFGAGLKRNGTPSDALGDRVQTAVELYRAGKVRKLLLTGDNGSTDYDEVTAMKRYAVARGVPADDVVLDYAGFRTYDSCYRAKAIFMVNDVIAVSQEFHLPRILYLCQSRGILTSGMIADKRDYRGEHSWAVREFIARTITWVEVNIAHPEPRFLGKKEPIFSN